MAMDVNDTQLSIQIVELLTMCQPTGDDLGAASIVYVDVLQDGEGSNCGCQLTLETARFNFPHLTASTRTHILHIRCSAYEIFICSAHL